MYLPEKIQNRLDEIKESSRKLREDLVNGNWTENDEELKMSQSQILRLVSLNGQLLAIQHILTTTDIDDVSIRGSWEEISTNDWKVKN